MRENCTSSLSGGRRSAPRSLSAPPPTRHRGNWVTPAEGRDLSSRQTQHVAKDMEIGQPHMGELWVKSVFIRACVKLRGLFRYPRSEPDCMTRPVSEHDQPHIRLPLETAVPTSRLRRAGAQGMKPFYQSACRAMVTIGSSTRIRQN